ncbi:MAG: glycosyltransferase family 8 protein [Firmicutes bacterium]|nr:glycosyltransferase family 8 protein [Bacillota bacterium]
MNILYCGDGGTKDGLLISVLSLIKNVDEPLHIYIMTMELSHGGRTFDAVPAGVVSYLDSLLKEKNPESSALLIDAGKYFGSCPPTANMDTRFTLYCMLRLYADMVDGIPDRILYLDIDVVVRDDITEFYYQDMECHELAGVLDHYGKWFFRNSPFRFDYLNSGVLLLNMKMIRETGLFEACRQRCAEREMFMPDQSALNKLSRSKKILPRKYNEQRRLKADTVMQHFTTSFRFFPWLHPLTVKPWQVERVHRELKLHEYDDILAKYEALSPELLRFS